MVRFGSFEVDLRSGELRRNGLAVRLQGQPFQILSMLLESPGELVTREEIRSRLWPADTFVDFEHSLNAAIKRLRDTLGETAENPVFIETLPRRGYRFLVPIQNGSINHSVTADAPGSRAFAQKRQRQKYGLTFLAVFAVLITGYIAQQRWRILPFRTSHALTPPMRVVPFTTSPGAEIDAAFSPDGNQIAYVWTHDIGWNAGLYVKFIGGEQPLRISQEPGSVCHPAWSPDGRYLAFQRSSGSQGTFIAPALTGPERRLSNQSACLGLTWSRDGKFLAFPAKDSAAEPWHISVLSLDTLKERRVTSPPSNSIGDHHPSFGPDSEMLAFTRLSSPGVTDLYIQPIDDGEARRLTFDKTPVWGSTWAGDGKSLVIASHRGGDVGLWRIPVSGGTPERLSVGSSSAFFPVISPRGDKLAYTTGALHTNIWRLQLDTSGRPSGPVKPLMQSSVSDEGPQFSPDGSKIVFDSQRSGSSEVWVAGADGSDPVQLTSLNVLSGTARWSPDGKFIAFDSRPGEHSQIFVISSVGGAPRQLTNGDFDASVPSWSRDGRWIYFTTNRLGIWQLFKVPVQGGEPIQVTKKGGFAAFESHDGSALYYWKDNDYGIWKMPLPDGDEARIVPVGLDWGRWALSENGIYFIDTRPSKPAISFFNFADQRISKIATVEKPLFFEVPAFDVSPDGRTILFLQVETETDIMLVENFQ